MFVTRMDNNGGGAVSYLFKSMGLPLPASILRSLLFSSLPLLFLHLALHFHIFLTRYGSQQSSLCCIQLLSDTLFCLPFPMRFFLPRIKTDTLFRCFVEIS